MMDLTGIHPKFQAWYGAQSDDVRAAIDAFFETTGGSHRDPKKVLYARRHQTLAFAQDTYGYDFTA